MCRSVIYYKIKPFLKGRCTPGTGSGMKRGGHDWFKTSYALKPTSYHLKFIDQYPYFLLSCSAFEISRNLTR